MKLSWISCCMVGLILALSLPAASAGCGQLGGDNNVLSVDEAKEVLEELPFRYKYRHVQPPKGATGALAGWMRGPKDTSVAFSLTLGQHTVPIPVPESGTGNSVGVPSAGFIFNVNTLVKRPKGIFVPSRELGDRAKLDEAGYMQIEIEERLCRAAIHEPCPV